MEKQKIQELFNKYATDLAPDFETETMNICDFTKFLEDNSIPMQLPVRVQIADKCSWCGGDKDTKDKGRLIPIVIHEGCYEGLMNGDGII